MGFLDFGMQFSFIYIDYRIPNCLGFTFLFSNFLYSFILHLGRKFKQAYISRDAAVALTSELEKIVLNTWNPYNTEPK